MLRFIGALTCAAVLVVVVLAFVRRRNVRDVAAETAAAVLGKPLPTSTGRLVVNPQPVAMPTAAEQDAVAQLAAAKLAGIGSSGN